MYIYDPCLRIQRSETLSLQMGMILRIVMNYGNEKVIMKS